MQLRLEYRMGILLTKAQSDDPTRFTTQGESSIFLESKLRGGDFNAEAASVGRHSGHHQCGTRNLSGAFLGASFHPS